MSTLKPMVINQSEQSWEGWDDAGLAAKSAIRWKILISGERSPSAGLVTGLAEFPVGTRLPLHHHEPPETYYIVSGRGNMVIDGLKSDIGPGSTVYIPSNAKHAVWCIGNEPLVFVFSFACDRFDEIVYHFDE